MATLINGMEIETHYVEWAVVVAPGSVFECEDEESARNTQREFGTGQVVVRHVFETAYAEVAG